MGQAIHMDGCVEVVEDIMASVSSNPGALVSLVRLKTQDGVHLPSLGRSVHP